MIGLVGAVFFSKNFVQFLICIEFIYYSIILVFISGLTLTNLNEGSVIYPLIILSLAAAEAAVGLSLLLVISKSKKSTSLFKFNKFKG
jgi:NADH-quinone oxidoreductase subunit K